MIGSGCWLIWLVSFSESVTRVTENHPNVLFFLFSLVLASSERRTGTSLHHCIILHHLLSFPAVCCWLLTTLACELRMTAESPGTFRTAYLLATDDPEGGTSTPHLLSPVVPRHAAARGLTGGQGVPNQQDDSERIFFDEDTFTAGDDNDQDQDHSHNRSHQDQDDDGATAALLPHYHSSSYRRSISNNISNSNNNSHSYRYRRQQLSGLNYLNAVTYVGHLFVSWGIGITGLFGLLDTRWHLQQQYLTLVTPAKWAYYLWAPILALEGIFALAQLTRYYRARPVVQAGTGFYFFYTFLIQTVWTVTFSFQCFVASFVAVLAALLSLLSLLASQKRALQGNRQGLVEYCLFCFPFYLHTGWMVLMTADQLSLLARAEGGSVALQLATDIVALGLLLAVAAVCCLAGPAWRDFVIPTVILWSLAGIAGRLHHPSADMVDLYGRVAVDAIRCATSFFAGAVGCLLVPNIVVWACREFCTIDVVELDG